MDQPNRFPRREWIPFHNYHCTVEPEQAATTLVPSHASNREKIVSRQRRRPPDDRNALAALQRRGVP